MEQEYLLRHEHNEFARRLEDENDRQNHRISELEKTVKQIGALTVSVEKMAVSMEQMLAEQKAQGKRMEVLESRDGEMWRKVTSYVITAIVGAVVCYVLTKIGL